MKCWLLKNTKGDKVQENDKESKTVHEMIHGEIRSYFKN